jgi:hypothetical protein
VRTRGAYQPVLRLEEAEFVLAVRNQDILVLAIVIEHHQMRLATEA